MKGGGYLDGIGVRIFLFRTWGKRPCFSVKDFIAYCAVCMHTHRANPMLLSLWSSLNVSSRASSCDRLFFWGARRSAMMFCCVSATRDPACPFERQVPLGHFLGTFWAYVSIRFCCLEHSLWALGAPHAHFWGADPPGHTFVPAGAV